MRSFADIDAWLAQPCTGTAETALAPWWRLIPQDVRIVLVRRPVGDVVDSLMALPGLTFDRAALTKAMLVHDRKLDQIAARREVLSVTFDDLNEETVCQRVFEYCLPYEHDHEHWAQLSSVNVQCHMVGLMRYAAAYGPAMEKLGKVAKNRILASMAVREPVSADGMNLQTEDFDTWLKDARDLFDEHLIRVGEAPGDWEKKNLPLMRKLFEAGAIQITTARSNGRMFGYLMTLISPSLASESMTSAANTTFFASPDVPGLGLKLQRAALRALKARGVGEVFLEAGQRGDGPRLGTLYRRLGATEHGHSYRLELTEH